MAEDLSALRSSLENGDWLEAELHGVSVGLGLAGAVVDPVGALAAAGAGWAMEHVGPLRTWLDDLAGDPPAVMADSGRLQDASRQVSSVVGNLRCVTETHLGPMEGRTVQACERFARTTMRDTAQFAFLLRAGATAMRTASGVVDAVRGLVRDAIAELVGMVTSSAVTVALTAGTGTPVVMARVALRAERLIVKLSRTLKSMARSFEALRLLLAQAESAMAALARAARARRPVAGPSPTDVSATWGGRMASEMMDRLTDIRPASVVVGVGAGGAATVAAGPEVEAP